MRPKTPDELALSYSFIEFGSGTVSNNKDPRTRNTYKESKFIFISPNGKEYTDVMLLAEEFSITIEQARSRCARGNCGFSRRQK